MPERFEELRRRAEDLIKQRRGVGPDPALEEAEELLHELSVYQTELELQNEELRRAQQALAAARDRYADLYDFAPVGYLALDGQGRIQAANLTLSGMLGVERQRLVGQNLNRFVLPEDQDGYHHFFMQLRRDGRGAARVVRLYQAHDDFFFGHLEGTAQNGPAPDQASPWLVTVTDVTEREHMRADLAAERAQLDAVIRHAPAGIVIADAEGQVVRANPMADRIYGGEVLLGPLSDETVARALRYPDGTPYTPAELPLVRAAREGEIVEGEEMQVLQPNGQELDVLVTAAPIRDRAERIVGAVTIFQDITARKRLEAELQQYVRRLEVLHQLDRAILAGDSAQAIAQAAVDHIQQLVDCHRCGVAAFDLEAQEGSLLALALNGETRIGPGWRAKLDELRYVETLLQGQEYLVEDLDALEARWPLLQTLWEEGLRSYLVLPLRAREELIGALKIGLDRPGVLSPEDLEVVRQMADVLAIGLEQMHLYRQVWAHRERLEELVAARTAELRRSEARFRAVFEQASIGMLLRDEAGYLLDTNRALQEILGYTAQELRGKHFVELTHPEDIKLSRVFTAQVDKGTQERYRIEKRYLRQDGMAVWVSITVFHATGAPGEEPLVIGMVEDITERKRALEAVIQSERLAVAGRLAGAMAHEINNPLQAIRSNLELVTEFDLPPEEQQHYLEICNLELERLSEITQRVLGFVRPSRGEREVVPVGELVRRTLDLVNKQLEHSQVRTRVDVPDNLPPVDVAPGEMVQVLMNVIVNAVEAMGSAPDGVPEGATDGGEIHIAARSEGDNVVLTLENDGPPIPSQDLARVFEPFFSTKTQGSGMGLAISYQIVQQHGGTMHVENLRGGQGVRFTVVLPASDA